MGIKTSAGARTGPAHYTCYLYHIGAEAKGGMTMPLAGDAESPRLLDFGDSAATNGKSRFRQ